MSEAQTGTYVNGKKQVIELLQALSPKERERILKHIRIKNPGMANELSQKSFSFASLKDLNEHDLTRISTSNHPKIFGIALKGVDVDAQREILSKVSREFAEVAYKALLAPQGSDARSIERAQDKVLATVTNLVRSRQISIN